MKHVASCSFGKDSLATILLALEHGEPLDEAVFVEVMFDHARNISSYGFKYGKTMQEVERMYYQSDADSILEKEFYPAYEELEDRIWRLAAESMRDRAASTRMREI